MNKKVVLLWAIALLLLSACGGGGETETDTPAANNNTSSSTTTESVEEDSTTSDSEEMEDEPAVTSNETEEAPTEVAAEEETVAEEAPEETAPASPFGDRPMSGTDPETGLVVNPESVRPGDTFIVRGKIISMNLTPTTSPEFLIQSPEGLKFRIRSQDLAETFYEDGDQLQPFQYQLGLLAQATAALAADASPSDIPTSTDLVLIEDE